MVGRGFELIAYEWNAGRITGFKVTNNTEFIGTIEKRNSLWIGAIAKGRGIHTFTNYSLEKVFDEFVNLTA